MMKKKVAFYTMGCKLNYAETSTIARKFSNLYYQHVPFKSYADIYVINSCSVTKNAEVEFRHIVRSAMNQNSQAFIIAIGCYAQLNSKKVSSIVGVDLVLGSYEKFKITDYLDLELLKKSHPKIISNAKTKNTYFPSFSVGDRTRSFLKIQDGCDYKCSYCIIPISRGASRSESIENILKNIRLLFRNGVKEIVLTGVNIGDYGKKIYGENRRLYTFFDLIQAIDQIKEKGRIRLSSIEPNLLKNECIEFLSKSKHFVPHFHIPLQSGSNDILGKMHRRYKRELYQEKVNKIRCFIPDAYIGSDIIVGFPGETHKHFLETYHFLKKLEISSLHIFTYSPRPNTKSITLQGYVSKKIQWKRNQILRNLSNKKYRFFCERQVYTKKTVLFEKNSTNQEYLYGYTENYIRTKIPLNSYNLSCYRNTLQEVFITKIDQDGIMIAEPIQNYN
ncbi:MiaB family tRNA modification enzyme: 2-methylthioadenine synthetase [Blattabacterium sp. (Blattella germanica) str. Bge]|uniref:tRNA (N(6)-L-threonylcarbamoyladenosine(37)-C(2))- methylthiotransferase MtaB n=1 Tax=Blattabacterium sp. (Blattella germanica) TaxID=624186 RepID=UPI0001BB619F|nr:tRNA (N(6)-L-threonylcarbamoyladenosine(37)-C(2))-methylthiotransferase MtaB [Blattabacterium sp. (Blattella germanica)]ACY40361.1 MiaB family tRNA modification enzyme: 2-methylthioadenine synthetase [Blattabacterium sp. (Blattella germanica) str. Bge]